MIALPAGARVWLAGGVTDMRKGMPGLALLVQEGLGRDPYAGDFYVFRGRSGSLVKILWHDGVGMLLYTKRLEHGRFISYGLCQRLRTQFFGRPKRGGGVAMGTIRTGEDAG